MPVIVHLGAEALNVFKDLPAEGVLLPYLSRVRAADRATEFRSRCRQLGITGVTLHSYRYAWAERDKIQKLVGNVSALKFEHLEAEGQRLLPEQLKTMLKALARPNLLRGDTR